MRACVCACVRLRPILGEAPARAYVRVCVTGNFLEGCMHDCCEVGRQERSVGSTLKRSERSVGSTLERSERSVGSTFERSERSVGSTLERSAGGD